MFLTVPWAQRGRGGTPRPNAINLWCLNSAAAALIPPAQPRGLRATEVPGW